MTNYSEMKFYQVTLHVKAVLQQRDHHLEADEHIFAIGCRMY